MNVRTTKEVFMGTKLVQEVLIYASLLPPPLPLPGLSPMDCVGSEWNQIAAHTRAFLVATLRHGKASTFSFKVFSFVVQAEALGNSLQSESNRKQ